MSIKRILVNTIDTDLEYEVIGIDLAKNCVSAILLTTDGEIFGIDRLDYQDGFFSLFPLAFRKFP